MEEMEHDKYLRRGSSVIFDRESLGSLIAGNCMVSLREALGWAHPGPWPKDPPGTGPTVLVSGLETCLTVMEPAEAEEFLRRRVKRLVGKFQQEWPRRGLVFGFALPSQSFEVTTKDEEVLFIRTDQKRVRLSAFLWNGSAAGNIWKIVSTATQGKRDVGFYVDHISGS